MNLQAPSVEGTHETAAPVAGVASGDWFASVAALWEHRPERLADVTAQIRTIYEKLVAWRMTPETRDELDHATIAYSHACVSYECVQWLPFDVMPNWEDDLFCVLMDEDFWREQRDLNKQGLIPVFDTREQAVAWAGTEKHVHELNSLP